MHACAVLKMSRREKKNARVCVSRLHRNEKSRFIPRGASVWNLKICLISSRWRTSFLASPDSSTATRTSPSEWPELLFFNSIHIYEFPCASVSKRVRVQNLSYENEFDLQENEPLGATEFHINGFAQRLVLI